MKFEQIQRKDDYILTQRGAILYNDESKQPRLSLPEGSTTKHVLSAGITRTGKPMATIQEENEVVCYILPDWYLDWCQTCVGISLGLGVNLFPAYVEFTRKGNAYSADIL